jgi:chromosome segregation ATPase
MTPQKQGAKRLKKSEKPVGKLAQRSSDRPSAIAIELSRIAERLADVATRIDAEMSASGNVTSQFSELSRELTEQRDAYLRVEVQLADLNLQLSGEQNRCRRLENELLQLRTALEPCNSA